MTQDKSSTKARVGKHLSFEERIQIQLLKTEGYSNRAIARRLNRAPQTIHNEIKRGTVVQKKETGTEWKNVYLPQTTLFR